jgi:hypothetical protein
VGSTLYFGHLLKSSTALKYNMQLRQMSWIQLPSLSPYRRLSALRLSALIDLYIHPLYVLVNKILSSILNSPAPIHPLYHPLSTLSTVGPTCHFI